MSNNCRCWHAFVDKNSLVSLRRASLRIGPTREWHSRTTALPGWSIVTLVYWEKSLWLIIQPLKNILLTKNRYFKKHLSQSQKSPFSMNFSNICSKIERKRKRKRKNNQTLDSLLAWYSWTQFKNQRNKNEFW